jgi:hypothetical protein
LNGFHAFRAVTAALETNGRLSMTQHNNVTKISAHYETILRKHYNTDVLMFLLKQMFACIDMYMYLYQYKIDLSCLSKNTINNIFDDEDWVFIANAKLRLSP